MSDSNQAYISKVHLKGYKSIKDLEIDLKPGLNIIIGPNGSGKTNFLEFVSDIDFNSIEHLVNLNFRGEVNRIVNNKLIQYYSRGEFIEKEDENIYAIYQKLLIDENVYYESVTRYLPDKNKPEVEELNNTIKDKNEIQYLRYETNRVSFNNPLELSLTIPITLKISIGKRTGAPFFSMNAVDLYFKILTLLTYGFKNKKFSNADKEIDVNIFSIDPNLIEVFKKYTPISSIRLDSTSIIKYKEDDGVTLDNIHFQFLINGKWLYWRQISDGTKRLFYIFLSILVDTSSTVLLEEPELGIHPNQLQKLIQFLKEQAKEKQIIITTHSPEVLNILGEDELDRIIVTRYDGENGTKMYKLSEKEQTHVRNYMKHQASISDYWIQSGFEKENEEEVAS